MDIGSAVGRAKGISAEKIDAIESFRESELFSAAEKAALGYAEEICRTPVDVPDTVFETLRGNFDDQAIVELTATVALENLRARFNRALQVPSDNLCPISEGGPRGDPRIGNAQRN
jgi:alkylhydroperoxidase family enzyme